MTKEEISEKLKRLPKSKKWLAFGTALTDVHGIREGFFVTAQELSELVLKTTCNDWEWKLNKDNDCLIRYGGRLSLFEASVVN